MLFGHGDDYYKSKHKVVSNYSSNVWYGANLMPLKEHLIQTFHLANNYPEPDAASLRNLLAKINNIRPSEVLVTNGSITAFYLIAKAWEGVCSSIFIPSFAEYEDACLLHHHKLTFINNKTDISSLSLNGQELCWICNPNNPDGKIFQKEEMECLLKNNSQTVFVIDQAYRDFCNESLFDLADIHKYANLILVQSISKLHKIPGIRIGYMVANSKLINRIREYLIPWSVNVFAIEAGKYSLSHPEQFPLPLEQWMHDAHKLQNGIMKLGVEVYPSSVPFFLNRLPNRYSAGDLKNFLLERSGILIRDASNFRGLDSSFFRLSTQSEEENNKLIESMKEFLLNS